MLTTAGQTGGAQLPASRGPGVIPREYSAPRLDRQVHRGQGQQERHEHRRHDERQAGPMAGVMNMLAGRAADRASAFRNRTSTLSADQMLAAHLASSGAGAYPVTSTMLDVLSQFPP